MFCLLSVFSSSFLQDYPYTAEGDRCRKDKCLVVPGTGVHNWVDVGSSEEVGGQILIHFYWSFLPPFRSSLTAPTFWFVDVADVQLK